MHSIYGMNIGLMDGFTKVDGGTRAKETDEFTNKDELWAARETNIPETNRLDFFVGL